MLLESAGAGGHCHTSGEISEESAPHCAGPPFATPWGTDTSPPLSCLLCQAFAELQDSHLNKGCVTSAQSSVTRPENNSPSRAALSCGFGRHRICTHWHRGAGRGQEVHPELPFPSLCCAFKRNSHFLYLQQRPQKISTCLAHTRLHIHCSRSKEWIRGCVLSLLPRPLLQAPSYLLHPLWSGLLSSKQEYSTAQCQQAITPSLHPSCWGWSRGRKEGRKLSPPPSFPRAIHLSPAIRQQCPPGVLAPFLAAQKPNRTRWFIYRGFSTRTQGCLSPTRTPCFPACCVHQGSSGTLSPVSSHTTRLL